MRQALDGLPEGPISSRPGVKSVGQVRIPKGEAYARVDQQLAGLLMWMPGGMVHVGAGLALLADLDSLERRITGLVKRARGGDKEAKEGLGLAERTAEALRAGKPSLVTPFAFDQFDTIVLGENPRAAHAVVFLYGKVSTRDLN